jgi:hypothetical protein
MEYSGSGCSIRGEWLCDDVQAQLPFKKWANHKWTQYYNNHSRQMLGLLFCSTFAAPVEISPELKAITDLCAANNLPPPIWSAEEACFANTNEQIQFQCEEGKLLFLYIRITQSYCKNQIACNSRLYFQFITIECSLVGRPWAQRDSQCCVWHSWSWPVVS